jgi:hypothetical protein
MSATALQRIKRLEAALRELRKAIEVAPHGYCTTNHSAGQYFDCDCWRAIALRALKSAAPADTKEGP